MDDAKLEIHCDLILIESTPDTVRPSEVPRARSDRMNSTIC